MLLTPNCSPIWCAPTGTTIARSPATAARPRRSRCWPGHHQSLIWARTRHTNGLRSALREYYPAALEVFDDLADRDALAILGRAPTPADAGRLSLSKIQAALKTAGRQSNLASQAQRIRAALRTPQLAAPTAVTAAFGASTRAAVGIIAELNRQISDLEAELATHFEAHPDADVYRSLPGLGVILGARVLGEFGDDPEPIHHRQASQKLRRNITINGRLRQEMRRAGPPHPQPPALRRHRPMGLLCNQLKPGSPHLLRPAPRRRRPTPPSPPRSGQPARRHPARLPPPTRPLRRTHRLGTPPTRHGGLTHYDPGMSSRRPCAVLGRSCLLPACDPCRRNGSGSPTLVRR